MTTDNLIAATLDAAAALTRALDAHRQIPHPEPVHAAADELRTVTAASPPLTLLGAAIADAAEYRIADSTLDVSDADARYEGLLDRLAVRCKMEAGRNLYAQLDRPDLASLPADELDRLAAVANWIDAPEVFDDPPPAA